jgi:hypothetical protein
MNYFKFWEEEHCCDSNHKNYCVVIDNKNYFAQVEDKRLTDIYCDNQEQGWMYGLHIYDLTREMFSFEEYKEIIDLIILGLTKEGVINK